MRKFNALKNGTPCKFSGEQVEAFFILPRKDNRDHYVIITDYASGYDNYLEHDIDEIEDQLELEGFTIPLVKDFSTFPAHFSNRTNYTDKEGTTVSNKIDEDNSRKLLLI